MANYMLIQFSKLKVPIISSEKEYEMTVADRKIVFNPFFESLAAFHIYTGYTRIGISELLRCNYEFMSAYQIERFVEDFKKDHKVEEIDYSFDKIPCIAEEGGSFDMYLSIVKHPISVSYAQEIELLGIIQDETCDRKRKLVNWWWKYCNNYAINTRLKRDSDMKVVCLAGLFCQLHGVSIESLSYDKANKSKIQLTIFDRTANALIFIVALIVYMSIAILIIKWGSEADSFAISGLLMTIGFAMIFVPVAILFGKK